MISSTENHFGYFGYTSSTCNDFRVDHDIKKRNSAFDFPHLGLILIRKLLKFLFDKSMLSINFCRRGGRPNVWDTKLLSIDVHERLVLHNDLTGGDEGFCNHAGTFPIYQRNKLTKVLSRKHLSRIKWIKALPENISLLANVLATRCLVGLPVRSLTLSAAVATIFASTTQLHTITSPAHSTASRHYAGCKMQLSWIEFDNTKQNQRTSDKSMFYLTWRSVFPFWAPSQDQDIDFWYFLVNIVELPLGFLIIWLAMQILSQKQLLTTAFSRCQLLTWTTQWRRLIYVPKLWAEPAKRLATSLQNSLQVGERDQYRSMTNSTLQFLSTSDGCS